MKAQAAVLWEQTGDFDVVDVELDGPEPTEVLVEMVATGLCRSDRHFALGEQPVGHLPIILGHEGSGIVRQVGSAVQSVKVGDHVVSSFIPSCGQCRWCARGMQNICDNGAMIRTGEQLTGGYRVRAKGEDVATIGGLGTLASWQVFDERSVVKIDPTIPLDVACLVGCGVATGFGSATNAADVRPGDVVVVVGAGGVGMNAVQGAALGGAANVVVVDTAPTKLKWATDFGATETFGDMAEADEFVKSITNGQGADSAILTAGTVDNELIGRGLGLISKGGTLVVTGVSSEHESGPVPGFNALGMALMQKRIQGVLYGLASPRDAMPSLLRQYQVGRLKLDELITNRYPLTEVMTGFSDMAEGRNIRGVIDFSL